MTSQSKPNVGLFVTCLVDAMRPRIGHAAIHLLEQAGCQVHIPETQTCCGQPGLNSGATDPTLPIARQLIKQFEGFDYVVVPSGSCAGTIKHSYPELFATEPQWENRAKALADKTWELMS
ncbi:MAG: heterodisulfide reductase-related iron-sulfur binding cluster, partial [Burkholderiaceae bacterium]